VLPFDRLRRAGSNRFELLDGGDFRPSDAGNIVVSLLGVLIVIAIVGSHQFTTIIVVVTFAILSGFRVARSAWVAVAAFGAGLVWLIGPALDYLRADGVDQGDRYGLPAESPDVVAAGTSSVSVGHAIVVIADRFLTLSIVALAVFGLAAIRSRSERGLLLASAVLTLFPGDVGSLAGGRLSVANLAGLALLAALFAWRRSRSRS